jgi:ankyrin repeat protein
MDDWQSFIGEHPDTEVMLYVRSHPEMLNAPDEGEQYLLEAAAYFLREALVENLLVQGADPNQVDTAGESALHSAIKAYGQGPGTSLSIVKLLIEHGADIERRCFPDFTALHRACVSGALDVVSLLVVQGADINARSEDRGDGGRRPLDIAEMYKHKHLTQYLRDCGGKNA